MDQDERMRIKWVELFEKTGNSGLMCLRCGIADPHSENEGSRQHIRRLNGHRRKDAQGRQHGGELVRGAVSHDAKNVLPVFAGRLEDT